MSTVAAISSGLSTACSWVHSSSSNSILKVYKTSANLKLSNFTQMKRQRVLEKKKKMRVNTTSFSSQWNILNFACWSRWPSAKMRAFGLLQSTKFTNLTSRFPKYVSGNIANSNWVGIGTDRGCFRDIFEGCGGQVVISWFYGQLFLSKVERTVRVTWAN